MERFSRKSRSGFLNWAKLEFIRGDINKFIATISNYKATISVRLGVITMYVYVNMTLP